MREPGALLAKGRDSDIFEYGPGLVLRRSRRQRSMAAEARTMEYARANGYPVPAVDQLSDDGTDLVMERLDGPSMFDALSRRPWSLRTHGRALGALHRQLHEIPAPEWLPDAPFGSGDRLLHLDLHPLNVVLTANGPVVIDWPNACRGDGDSDVALTWLLVSAGDLPTNRLKAILLSRGRALFADALLSPFDRDAVTAQLAEVVAWKAADANITEAEQRAMWSMLSRNT
jgi:aminoglycoside phosphotransferase (APT) family kinase protein